MPLATSLYSAWLIAASTWSMNTDGFTFTWSRLSISLRMRTIVARDERYAAAQLTDHVGQSAGALDLDRAAVARIGAGDPLGLDVDLGLGDAELDRLQRSPSR